jgi:hypothetical protein
LNSKLFNTNEDVAHKITINFTDAAELRNTGNSCIKLDVNRRMKLVTRN